MPILENRILSNVLSGDDQHEASTKLSTQAFEYTAVAALAATTLLIASKGRVLPDLALVGESAGGTGLRTVPAFGGRVFGKQALGLADDLVKPMKLAFDAVETKVAQIAGSTVKDAVTGSRGLVDDVAKTLKPSEKLMADIELGARPGWQYANGAKELDAKYLGFTRGWPVEGVTVNKEGVNLFTTKNHHWVKIGPFDRPAANTHALDDLMSTYIADVKTGSSSGKQLSSIVLKRDTASAYGTELTGRLKPIEFWL
ncbi:hypothetical protein KBI23_09295 [bacterium]|nr:hypothetical protein [bacterium]MBP9810554.1 hypothetical protein [bacterium]